MEWLLVILISGYVGYKIAKKEEEPKSEYKKLEENDLV